MPRPSSRIVGGGIIVDTADIQKFAVSLRKAQPVLSKEMRSCVRKIGTIIAVEAKKRVSPFSTSVPPTIKVKVLGAGATVMVVAGGPSTPMASLLELGNAKGGSGGMFRHPVFGNMTVWVSQPMHPYLAAAGQDKASEAEELMTLAIDRTLEVAAFGEDA